MSFLTDAIGSILGTNDAADEYAAQVARNAELAKFKPQSFTTGFGTSTFTPQGGGGYTLDPRLAAMRDVFYGGALQALPGQAGVDFSKGIQQYGIDLFNRAQGTNIGQKTQDYYNQVISGMAPSRAQEETRLANTLFSQGRTGAGVGTSDATGYVNPEQFALLKAREGQNTQLYLGAEDRARQQQLDDIKQALSTYGLGSEILANPYKTASGLFGLGTGLEQLGMTPLDLSYKYGTAASNAGANVASMLNQGAGAQYNANLANAGIFSNLLGSVFPASSIQSGMSKLGSWAGNLFGGSSSTGGGDFTGGIQLPRYY